MEFSHIGLITTQPKPGETFVEATRVWITDFVKHPQHVEWLRFEPDSPVTGARAIARRLSGRVDRIGGEGVEDVAGAV